MSFPSFPVSVTYTGSAGAGMTASIVENLGSLQGAGLTFQNRIGERTDVQRYRVAGPGNSYDAELALTAAGLGYGSVHPYIPGIVCHGVKLERPSKEGYVMQAIFQRPVAGALPGGSGFGFTMLGVSFTAMEIPAEVDNYGNIVVNSAGDPFNPPQNLTIYLMRLKMTRWQTSYPIFTARRLVGKVNHDDIVLALFTASTIPARCLKVLNFAPAQEISPLATLAPIVYEVEWRGSLPTDGQAGGYDRWMIDKGYQAFYSQVITSEGGKSAGATAKGKISARASLQPVAEPVLLDGTGQPLQFAGKPDPYTVVDYKNGFYGWHTADPRQLPLLVGDSDSYLTAVQPHADRAYYLPYRIEREADLTPLVDAGL